MCGVYVEIRIEFLLRKYKNEISSNARVPYTPTPIRMYQIVPLMMMIFCYTGGQIII